MGPPPIVSLEVNQTLLQQVTARAEQTLRQELAQDFPGACPLAAKRQRGVAADVAAVLGELRGAHAVSHLIVLGLGMWCAASLAFATTQTCLSSTRPAACVGYHRMCAQQYGRGC